jgi:hypothetical protein
MSAYWGKADIPDPLSNFASKQYPRADCHQRINNREGQKQAIYANPPRGLP